MQGTQMWSPVGERGSHTLQGNLVHRLQLDKHRSEDPAQPEKKKVNDPCQIGLGHYFLPVALHGPSHTGAVFYFFLSTRPSNTQGLNTHQVLTGTE